MGKNIDIGKIYKFDGVTGEIITDNDTYVFSYNGLEEKVEIGDIVSFKKQNINSDVVTDIKKYNNSNLQTLLSEYIKKRK